MAIKEITKGTRFGRLTVTGEWETRKSGRSKIAFHKCICDCGNEVWVRGTGLRYGSTLSCGCYRTEQRVKIVKKHNLSNTRLYRIWNDMRTRCNKKYDDHYSDYGGRGIKVCSEWDNTNDGFQNFYEWSMANGYSDDLSIDRMNNDGNYEPSNCRWVTQAIQNRNKRTNHYLEYQGEKMILSDVAEIANFTPTGFLSRLRNGMSVQEAIEKPKKAKRLILYKGKMMTPREFSDETGICYNTIMTRITKGYTKAEDLCINNRNAMIKKPVEKYDLKGNYIESYPSASEAARQNNCCKSGVIECCNGKKQKFKGFIYKYKPTHRGSD